MGLLEQILDRNNMNKAFKKVRLNKVKPGSDGMTVEKLLLYLKENCGYIRHVIMDEIYCSQPVARSNAEESVDKRPSLQTTIELHNTGK